MASDSQTKPNEEPPAGIQGKGTIDEPYDQGNTPGKLVASDLNARHETTLTMSLHDREHLW